MAQNVTFNINLKVDGKDAVRKVTMNVEELRHVIDETKDATERLTASFIRGNQWSETCSTLSSSLTQLTATLNTLTAESRSFGGAMAAANTMAGKGGEDFARLKDEVSSLAKTVPVARDELAAGLYQVISNGVPEDNWISYLEQSAKASVGGIADLGEVVKVTSTVIKNYGLSWDQAADIQDKIQLTARNGVTSFEQMAQALPRVTAQASALGVGVDELMASFATLTGVSGNTAEVSTQLAAVFTALIKPSSEAAETARQMGIRFDAAAIKAAGGMQQFLTQLDRDVKSFARSSGMLEQEVYGRLFGSAESLRALTPLTGELADKFSHNVDSMKDSAGTVGDAFATMAATGKARLQMLNNQLGQLTDFVQSTFGNVMPYLNFGTQALASASSVAQLAVSMKSLGVAFNVVTAASSAMNRARLSAVAVSRTLAAAFRGEAAGAATAAVAARTLTLAVRGLLVATGAGLAVTALTMAISHLSSTAAEASPAADGLRQAEEAAVAASAEAKTAIDGETSRLRRLIQAGKDTSKAVSELNQRYGEAFGYHKTAAAWYDTLTRKSQTYIRQLGYEAQAQALASRMAENDIRLQNNYGKRRELWQKGQAQTTTVQYMGGTPGTQGTYRTARQDTEAYRTLKQEGAELLQQQKEYRRQWDIVSGRLRQTSADMRAVGTATAKAVTAAATPPAGSKGPTATAAEADPLEGSIDWYEKRIRDLRSRMEATADEAAAAGLRRQTEAAEKELSDLKVRIGIETPPEPELKTRLARMRDQLDRAQADFDDAATVEAKVKADARVADLQRQISEATRGKLSIEADTEPSYVTRGSAADRRQSYANAQQRARRIQQDYEIGLTGQDEARKQMEELNAEVARLGLKPVTIDIRTRGLDRALGSIREGWSAVSGIGSGIESMTEALKGNGDAWQTVSAVVGGFLQATEGITAVVRIVEALSATTRASAAATAAGAAASTAAATATTASGAANTAATATAIPLVAANKLAAASYMEMAAAAYMAAHAYIPFAGFGIGASFAASAKALVTAVGATPFADGGLVYGPTLALMGEYAGAKSNPEVIAPLSKLQSIIGPQGGAAATCEFRVKGNDLVAVLANQTRSQRRKSNIRI